MRLLPKEHGAYGQVALPLLTALGVAGVTLPAALLVVAVAAGFLAHEPWLVLLGARGDRTRREVGAVAARWLAAETVLAVSASTWALALASADARLACLLPVPPAAVLAVTLARRREKSLVAELSAAQAFAFAAVPVCAAAGAPLATGVAVALPFALVFTCATLAVRAVTQAVRGGGHPRAVVALRAATWVLGITGCAALAAAAGSRVLPWSALAAALPGVIVTLGLATWPPPSRRLKTVGWTLMTVSVAAGAILIAS